MNALNLAWAYPTIEERNDPRFPVELPATLSLDDQDHSARVVDLGPGGAMIETAVRFTIGLPLYFRCGAIVARGMVVWKSGERLGFKFDDPLSESELQEQTSRSGAIACRKLEFAR